MLVVFCLTFGFGLADSLGSGVSKSVEDFEFRV